MIDAISYGAHAHVAASALGLADGADVDTLIDQITGMTYNVAAFLGAPGAVYRAARIGGQPAVEFLGAEAVSADAPPFTEDAECVFVVYEQAQIMAGYTLLWDHWGDGENYLSMVPGGYSWYFADGDYAVESVGQEHPVTAAIWGTHVVALRRSQAGWSIWEDGLVVKAQAAAFVTDLSLGEFRFGRGGYFAEVVALPYEADDNLMRTIINELCTDYGITYLGVAPDPIVSDYIEAEFATAGMATAELDANHTPLGLATGLKARLAARRFSTTV